MQDQIIGLATNLNLILILTTRLNLNLNSRKDDLGLYEQKTHKFSGITVRLMG